MHVVCTTNLKFPVLAKTQIIYFSFLRYHLLIVVEMCKKRLKMNMKFHVIRLWNILFFKVSVNSCFSWWKNCLQIYITNAWKKRAAVVTVCLDFSANAFLPALNRFKLNFQERGRANIPFLQLYISTILLTIFHTISYGATRY